MGEKSGGNIVSFLNMIKGKQRSVNVGNIDMMPMIMVANSNLVMKNDSNFGNCCTQYIVNQVALIDGHVNTCKNLSIYNCKIPCGLCHTGANI